MILPAPLTYLPNLDGFTFPTFVVIVLVVLVNGFVSTFLSIRPVVSIPLVITFVIGLDFDLFLSKLGREGPVVFPPEGNAELVLCVTILPLLVLPAKLGREGSFDKLTGFTTVVGDFFISKEIPLFLKSLKVGLSVLVNVGLLGGVVLLVVPDILNEGSFLGTTGFTSLAGIFFILFISLYEPWNFFTTSLNLSGFTTFL